MIMNKVYLVAFLVMSTGTALASGGHYCNSFFRPPSDSVFYPKDYLEDFPLTKIRDNYSSSSYRAEVRTNYGLLYKSINVLADGMLAGYLDVRITNILGRKVMKVINMEVELRYARQYIGTYMMAKILYDHPDVEVIKSTLFDSNFNQYNNQIQHGASHIDALKTTPAYKIRARFGYTEIVRAHNKGFYLGHFIVKKPSKGD